MDRIKEDDCVCQIPPRRVKAEGTGFEPVRALLLKGLATPRFGPLSQPS